MKHLDPQEWLDQAKRLHVGTSKRTYHGAESRPNMVVRNMPDRYTVWCHACNKGGVVRKDVVKLVQPAQVKERPADSADPGQLWHLGWDYTWFSSITRHLQDKGMSTMYLRRLNPMYSPKDNRLVLTTPECTIGRSLDPGVKAKWHTYQDAVGYTRASFKDFKDSTVVLTEDLYSACKVQWYCPEVLAVACLGTKISAGLMTKLLLAERVITWFDGDAAGDKARVTASRALSTMGVLYSHIKTDSDPKELHGDNIIVEIGAAYVRT